MNSCTAPIAGGDLSFNAGKAPNKFTYFEFHKVRSCTRPARKTELLLKQLLLVSAILPHRTRLISQPLSIFPCFRRYHYNLRCNGHQLTSPIAGAVLATRFKLKTRLLVRSHSFSVNHHSLKPACCRRRPTLCPISEWNAPCASFYCQSEQSSSCSAVVICCLDSREFTIKPSVLSCRPYSIKHRNPEDFQRRGACYLMQSPQTNIDDAIPSKHVSCFTRVLLVSPGLL